MIASSRLRNAFSVNFPGDSDFAAASGFVRRHRQTRNGLQRKIHIGVTYSNVSGRFFNPSSQNSAGFPHPFPAPGHYG